MRLNNVNKDDNDDNDDNDDVDDVKDDENQAPSLNKKQAYNGTMEVYFYRIGQLCIIQNRNQFRRGGRVEFVGNLINWIKEYKFCKVILLTSEALASVNDDSQLSNMSNFDKRFVFYCNNNEMNDEISKKLNWELSLTNELLNKKNKPKSSLLVDNDNDNDSDSDNGNETKQDQETEKVMI